jgi:hypothetical protein
MCGVPKTWEQEKICEAELCLYESLMTSLSFYRSTNSWSIDPYKGNIKVHALGTQKQSVQQPAMVCQATIDFLSSSQGQSYVRN